MPKVKTGFKASCPLHQSGVDIFARQRKGRGEDWAGGERERERERGREREREAAAAQTVVAGEGGADAILVEVTVLAHDLSRRASRPPSRRANMAHIRQSRPDYGFDFQVKSLKLSPSSIGRGRDRVGPRLASRPLRAKRGQLETFQVVLPEGRGRNLAVTVIYVPCSLDSGQSRP